jgi:hypothetical protein
MENVALLRKRHVLKAMTFPDVPWYIARIRR